MLAERLTAQLLAGEPACDPVAVAERLLAVQAQDLRGARLAVRSRTAGLSASDVDRALTDDRSLLVTTLNRGTLHLVRVEDYPWLQALTTPPVVVANARRLEQEGVSPEAAERGVSVIERALASGGPSTRAQLRERLDVAGVPTAGQALAHVLMLAALRGVTVRGPVVGGEQAWVLVHDWVRPPAPVDRAAALKELALRFLAGHGPVSERDLATWAGVGLRDARAGLRAAGPAVTVRADGLLDRTDRAPAASLPAPRLLGAFEPVLMGSREREWVLGSHTSFVTVNGIFRPIVLVGGRAVGTWGIPRGAVALDLFDPVGARDRRALDADAADVERFLAG